MQLSREECLRISEMQRAPYSGGVRSVGIMATAPARQRPLQEDALRLPADVQRVTEQLESAMEIREEIVESLQARIESGSYYVSGEVVAEMLLRRMLADRVR